MNGIKFKIIIKKLKIIFYIFLKTWKKMYNMIIIWYFSWEIKKKIKWKMNFYIFLKNEKYII